MNRNERVAYEYLLEQGYGEEGIDFNKFRSIDFICSDEKKYEAKTLFNNYLNFTRKQWNELKSEVVTIIVVDPEKERVVDVFPFRELEEKGYDIHIQKGGSKTIKVSDYVHEHLEEIKKNQQHTSMDSVLRELLQVYGRSTK